MIQPPNNNSAESHLVCFLRGWSCSDKLPNKGSFDKVTTVLIKYKPVLMKRGESNSTHLLTPLQLTSEGVQHFTTTDSNALSQSSFHLNMCARFTRPRDNKTFTKRLVELS